MAKNDVAPWELVTFTRIMLKDMAVLETCTQLLHRSNDQQVEEIFHRSDEAGKMIFEPEKLVLFSLRVWPLHNSLKVQMTFGFIDDLRPSVKRIQDAKGEGIYPKADFSPLFREPTWRDLPSML